VNAEAFYRRAGYEIVGQGVHLLGGGIEMASVKMRRRLTGESTRATGPASG
jgi:hypothetical protein